MRTSNNILNSVDVAFDPNFASVPALVEKLPRLHQLQRIRDMDFWMIIVVRRGGRK